MQKDLIKEIFKLNDSQKQTEVFSQSKYEELPDINIHLHKHLQNIKFTTMTKIQKESFNPIFSGKDTFIKSQTGSGKTLAYLVPILNYMIGKEVKIQRYDGCHLLIIVPTRELGLQIYKLLEKLTKACVYIVPGILVGGEEIKKEKARLRKGLNIIVGTPGRILYHLQNTQNFVLNKLETIVYEEADRILDFGFDKELNQILQIINEQVCGYQNVMVSATINEKLELLLEKLSLGKEEDIEEENKEEQQEEEQQEEENKEEQQEEDQQEEQQEKNKEQENKEEEEKKIKDAKKEEKLKNILDNFKLVGFDRDNLKELKTPIHLKHFYTIIDQRKKVTLFLTLLKLLEDQKSIVFVSTADQVNYFSDICSKFQIKFPQEKSKEQLLKNPILKIHGFMQQKERSKVYLQFSQLKKGILFSTEVSQRGLDFPDVQFIILLDVSPSYKDYINRVGRAGRIENNGAAISLLYEEEVLYCEKLEKNVKAEELKFFRIENAFQTIFLGKEKIKNFFQNFDQELKYLVNQNLDSKYLARRAFNSYCRAYSHIKDKEYFNLKNLNLHKISKSYGLMGAKSKGDIDKKEYTEQKDAKILSKSEQTFLDRKKKNTQEGSRIIQSKNFMTEEFANQFQFFNLKYLFLILYFILQNFPKFFLQFIILRELYHFYQLTKSLIYLYQFVIQSSFFKFQIFY